MTSLGHRVGLFDAMADMPAASSEAIAARSGLNERHVREWLGAMVASGVVDYDPRDGTYALSADAVIAHRTSSDLSPQSRRLTASDPFTSSHETEPATNTHRPRAG
jgi:DNA-binding IclR family transcriptional regulator